MKIADSTFGINPQALKVLKLLSKKSAFFFESNFNTETHTWYNGREKGFTISMRPYFPRFSHIHIAVFEHRNSDNICALLWTTKSWYLNGPIADEKTLKLAYPIDDKYETAVTFGYGEYQKMADWVYGKLKDFYILSTTLGEIR